MVKIRGILNARIMNVLQQEQGKVKIKKVKIKIVVFSTYFFYLCAAMTRFRHKIRHCEVKMTYFVTQNVS